MRSPPSCRNSPAPPDHPRRPKQKLALLVLDAAGGIGDQLDHCRKADLFCTALGRGPANACTVPDRLVDALGMGKPLCAILPDGSVPRLVTEAGGMTAPAGDAQSITALFRTMSAAWRSRSLIGASEELRQRHAIGSVIHELTLAIADQYVK